MKIRGFHDITQAKKKSQSTETCHLALCPLNQNLMGTEDSIEKIWLEI